MEKQEYIIKLTDEELETIITWGNCTDCAYDADLIYKLEEIKNS